MYTLTTSTFQYSSGKVLLLPSNLTANREEKKNSSTCNEYPRSNYTTIVYRLLSFYQSPARRVARQRGTIGSGSVRLPVRQLFRWVYIPRPNSKTTGQNRMKLSTMEEYIQILLCTWVLILSCDHNWGRTAWSKMRNFKQ